MKPADSHSIDPEVVLTSIGEVVYAWNLLDDSLSWGANADAVLHLDGKAVLDSGRAYAALLAPESAVSRWDAVTSGSHRDTGAGVYYQIEYGLRLPGREHTTWIEDCGRWFAGPDGRPAVAHGLIRIIDARHARDQQLAMLSRVDPLTGQMNRAALGEALNSSLQAAVKERRSMAFVLASVDVLARLNDVYGFEVADEVIAEVTKRLRAHMRGVDLLGRYSGNKLGLVLQECTAEQLIVAGDRFAAAVRETPVMTSAGPISITVSLGGAVGPRHARTAAELMARAQEALDAAKSRRRGSFSAYQPNIERDRARRESARMTDEIISALNERRVVAVFQPIVDAASRVPHHYECLLRIRNADGSLSPAGAIVPLAEKVGLISLIDHRMLELAVTELAEAPDLRLTVNVSPETAIEHSWIEALAAHVRAHPGIAGRLVVEITETTVFRDLEEAKSFVSRIRSLGCLVAIDDFGAGYTSFRNLRALEADIVKIDGVFMHNLAQDEDDQMFVRALLKLANHAGMTTIAEWVQDEASARLLAGWGCQMLQGALTGMASENRPWLDAARRKVSG